MADEKQAQGPEQEQVQVQGEEPVQEPAEKQEEDKPVKEKKEDDGLLMPFLYALLAAAGAFTLVMIIGIVLTFFTRPAQPSETPSAEPSTQITQTWSYRSPDSEGSDLDASALPGEMAGNGYSL